MHILYHPKYMYPQKLQVKDQLLQVAKHIKFHILPRIQKTSGRHNFNMYHVQDFNWERFYSSIVQKIYISNLHMLA